jgi:membrane-bound lytic murein transglycosylase D
MSRLPFMARLGAVLVATALATACGSAPTRRAPSAAVVEVAPAPEAPIRAPEPRRETPPAERAAATETTPRDVWERVREGLGFTECHDDDRVAAEIRRYLAGGRFARMLEPMLPRLEFVLREVERRRLPTEFALLPIVESHYQPIGGRHGGPAGPWQLMPTTARAQGLAIGKTYDARLDLGASTHAALDLVERLADRFGGDWHAVVKAYNAGEFRVRRARASGDPEVWRRRLSATTLTHHARLVALACIVREPSRFGLDLPAMAPGERLAAHRVEAALDFDLAAAAAGLARRDLLADNAGFHGEQAPAGSYLLVPAGRIERFETLIAAVPKDLRGHWTRRDAERGDWPALASATGVAAEALATLNASALDAPVPASVLMPGPAPRDAPAAAADERVYVVRGGDSPWRIARRLRIRLADLLAINGLDRSAVLHPGQRLRIP